MYNTGDCAKYSVIVCKKESEKEWIYVYLNHYTPSTNTVNQLYANKKQYIFKSQLTISTTTKSQLYFYTLTSLIWNRNKTNPFTIAPKTVKYLGINLTKEVERSVLSKLQNLGKNWRRYKGVSYTLWSEKIILLKCPYSPKPSIDQT